MLVGIIIGAIIVALALYDYFSSRSWQMLTSDERNETVFEKRNKAYGAYRIRREYNNQVLLILLGLSTGIGGLYAATRAFTEPVDKTERVVSTDVPQELPKDEEEEVVEEEETTKPTSEPAGTPYVFNVFQIVNDPNANDTLSIPNPGDPVTPGDPGGDPLGGGGGGTGGGDPQPPKDSLDSEGVPPNITEVAYFPGGKKKMMEFIMENINQEVEGSGKTKLKFLVGKDGTITKVWVIEKNTDCDGCDEAAKAVVKAMPKWVPGKSNGTPVNSYFYLPISFR